jgi:hypothetical protein
MIGESELYRIPDAYSSNENSPVRLEFRKDLVIWLHSVVTEFKFSSHTLGVAVNIMDRFLVASPVQEADMQLVAITALFLASKLHERRPIRMAEICELFEANAAPGQPRTSSRVKRWELMMLVKLNWAVNAPSLYSFASHMLRLIDSRCVAYEKLVFSVINKVLQDARFLVRGEPSVAYAIVNAVLGCFHDQLEADLQAVMGVVAPDVVMLSGPAYDTLRKLCRDTVHKSAPLPGHATPRVVSDAVTHLRQSAEAAEGGHGGSSAGGHSAASSTMSMEEDELYVSMNSEHSTDSLDMSGAPAEADEEMEGAREE